MQDEAAIRIESRSLVVKAEAKEYSLLGTHNAELIICPLLTPLCDRRLHRQFQHVCWKPGFP